MDGWLDGRVSGWMDVLLGRRVIGCMAGCLDGWVNGNKMFYAIKLAGIYPWRYEYVTRTGETEDINVNIF
jgi:hypothetical protein